MQPSPAAVPAHSVFLYQHPRAYDAIKNTLDAIIDHTGGVEGAW